MDFAEPKSRAVAHAMQGSTITMANFRADRFATLYFFRPIRSIVSGDGNWRIPILMYHSIGETEGEGRHPYFRTETSPLAFETHIKYLHDNRYTVISPEDVVGLLGSGRVDTKKYAVVTFDDGYRDFYTNAFPILDKYRMSATVYLPTAYIQSHSHLFKGKECMTWDEVREMHAAGIKFGSHTVSHPQLELLSDADLRREIRTSKDAIEAELGTPVRSFAYPYAFPEQNHKFTGRLRDLLEESGYENGVSTIVGSTHSLEDKFFLKRLPANSCDDTAFLEAKLLGDYDWLHAAQYFYKKLARPAANGKTTSVGAQ